MGQELDCLEGLGVLKKVNHAAWAAPVVPVHKKDGTLRLCGDYKVTINPDLLVDQYPLLKPADLMACLTEGGGVVCFTKLDLTSAYQQMEFDDKSQGIGDHHTSSGPLQIYETALWSGHSSGHFPTNHGCCPERNIWSYLFLR